MYLIIDLATITHLGSPHTIYIEIISLTDSSAWFIATARKNRKNPKVFP